MHIMTFKKTIMVFDLLFLHINCQYTPIFLIDGYLLLNMCSQRKPTFFKNHLQELTFSSMT
jgi:hypothetical protein